MRFSALGADMVYAEGLAGLNESGFMTEQNMKNMSFFLGLGREFPLAPYRSLVVFSSKRGTPKTLVPKR